MSEVRRYERERVANKSTYWLIWELAVRDFYRFICMKYGSRIFQLTGAKGITRVWVEDGEKLQRWKDGMTGVPLVDAHLRELKQTGEQTG